MVTLFKVCYDLHFLMGEPIVGVGCFLMIRGQDFRFVVPGYNIRNSLLGEYCA